MKLKTPPAFGDKFYFVSTNDKHRRFGEYGSIAVFVGTKKDSDSPSGYTYKFLFENGNNATINSCDENFYDLMLPFNELSEKEIFVFVLSGVVPERYRGTDDAAEA